MFRTRVFLFLLMATAFLAVPSAAEASLINPSFEAPRFSPGVPSVDFANHNSVPGWRTTAPDSIIEFWSDGFGGITSFRGAQHVELNANVQGALFQDVPRAEIPVGAILGFEFAHRGRGRVDNMRLTITDLGPNQVIGGGDDRILFQKDYSTGPNAWVFYTSAGEAPLIALGNNVRFAYESRQPGSVGNFLDAADFGVGVGAVPEPSSLLIGGVSLLGLLGYGWRRGARKSGPRQAV